MKVYERVCDYIQRKGLKQKAIAEAAKIPVSTFNAMMHGKRTMYAEDLKAVCIALEVSADLFVWGKDSEKAG